MGQDVTVLFSSPCKTRWKSRKEGSNCVGLGVEVPSDAECLEIRKLLYRETPICLCDPSDRNYTQINACLNVLGLDGKAEDYERKRLFGNQFRYLFGDSGDILVGLDGLKTAIMKYAHDGILVPYDNTVESVASHKLMQLNFDLDRRAFYHMFVSGLVIFLAVKKLQDLEEIKMCKNLLQYEEQDEVMYGKIFEKHVILKIERGVSFLARSLEGQENSEFSFSPSKTVFFTYAIYTPIQIWFQDINHTSLLGFTLINRNTLFYPTGPRCYTVDAILVEKFTNRIVVNFIQATVSKNHSVSPGGFFAMFMFVKLISIANKCDVDVTFIFVVPENIFDVFQSSEAEYLHSLFEDVEIFVMKINDGEQNNAVLSGTHSSATKIQANKNVKQHDKHFIRTKRTSDSAVKPNDSLKMAMVQKSSELHSLLKGIAFNVETQEQNKNSERNVNQDLAILLLETPEFENINLKLSWNIEIQCVFPQSEVFVINSLNKPEKSDEQGFGDDSSEEMSSKSDLSNDSDEDQNISSSTKKEKKKRKKRKKKKTPASKTKSDKYTNPSLIFFNDYEKDIVDFDGKQSIINYSEICTLFYKKSKKKNPEDDKKKEKKILNLLSELNYGTEKNFVVDNDAVFEIAFTNDYGDREILVLLGCLNLHLANIMIEHSTFQKVILKFSPFESQANFLKRIQEHVFNKLLMKVGLCMDLTNIKLT